MNGIEASVAAKEIKKFVEEYENVNISKNDLIEIIKNKCDSIIRAGESGWY